VQREFRLLGSDLDRAAVSCGEPSLDTYLKTQATQDMKRGLAACHVLTEVGGATIMGYYTLSATSVVLTDLPPDLLKKAGRYRTVPAVLLGRLTVDSPFQGQGIGDVLLGDALLRVLQISREAGVMLVIVDALNERVVGFYERRQFKRFQDHPLRLYLPVATIRGMYPEAATSTGSAG
jgi:GNAT superfamily N-acetyltransferase